MESEWVHSEQLLAQIAGEQLEQELIELAGARMWELVQLAHVELGEVLGLEAAAPPPGPSVGEQVRSLAAAIGDLGRIYAGNVTNDAQLDVFESVMRPLAELRALQGSGGGEQEVVIEDGELEGFEGEELELEEPLPEVEAAA